jgi:tetratricopeptide (TPR) repeat protein
MASSGLADLALYEGRFAEAARILEQGATNDLGAKNPENAADKLTALAYVQLSRGQKAAAVAAAEKALANSQAVQVRFTAARIFVEAGDLAKARKLAASLGAELQVEPQSYAKVIEGMAAAKRGETRQAIAEFTEAKKLFDTWISRFELGRAYLEAGLFVEASSEFDRCVERRGEAIELFMNNVPTIGYFPLVYYYQGRVREGLKSPGFVEPYRTYLSIRGKSTEDPLVPEIRRRAGE